MAKPNNIPEEVKTLTDEFAKKLKALAPNGEIPAEWWNAILIHLGLKRPRGRQVETEDRDLTMCRAFLRYCLGEERKGRTLSDNKAYEEWIQTKPKMGFKIIGQERFLDRFRILRPRVMTEILEERLDKSSLNCNAHVEAYYIHLERIGFLSRFSLQNPKIILKLS